MEQHPELGYLECVLVKANWTVSEERQRWELAPTRSQDTGWKAAGHGRKGRRPKQGRMCQDPSRPCGPGDLLVPPS